MSNSGLKKFGNKLSAMESWVIRFAEDYAVMKLEEQKELAQSSVMHRFLIYADDYITWNKDINDWNHSAEFTGIYLDAHEYARSLYGKKYTLNRAQRYCIRFFALIKHLI
jgi:hypothetical protein